MTRLPPIPVTDHAVLRWLEREMGLPVEQIRAAIGEGCAEGGAVRAKAVIWGRCKFIIEDGKVITTLKREWTGDVPKHKRKRRGRRGA